MIRTFTCRLNYQAMSTGTLKSPKRPNVYFLIYFPNLGSAI